MVAKRARDRASRGRIALRPDQESTGNHAYFLVAQLLVEVLGGFSTTGLPASTAQPEKNPRARAPALRLRFKQTSDLPVMSERIYHAAHSPSTRCRGPC